MRRSLMVLIAVSFVAAAQTMFGLPNYGVELEGTPQAPLVVNHSGRTVIGFVLRFTDSTGWSPISSTQLLVTKEPPNNSIPDGRSLVAVATAPTGAPARLVGIVGAELDSVIFAADASGIADFVGPDKSGVFYDMSQRMLLMSQIGSELVEATDKAAAWKQIHDVSSWRPTDGLPDGVGRKEHLVRWMVSNELLSEQSPHGDDEALKLAGRYAALADSS